MKKILQFSTPTCGQCRMVSDRIKKSGVQVEHVDCGTADGGILAGKFGIYHVPCVLVLDEESGKLLERYDTLPAILKFLSDLRSDDDGVSKESE